MTYMAQHDPDFILYYSPHLSVLSSYLHLLDLLWYTNMFPNQRLLSHAQILSWLLLTALRSLFKCHLFSENYFDYSCSQTPYLHFHIVIPPTYHILYWNILLLSLSPTRKHVSRRRRLFNFFLLLLFLYHLEQWLVHSWHLINIS